MSISLCVYGHGMGYGRISGIPARPRVVIAGLGDSGLLTAIHLTRHCDVVGISNKPGLLSGKELGTRLTRPQYWVQDYWISFDRSEPSIWLAPARAAISVFATPRPRFS